MERPPRKVILEPSASEGPRSTRESVDAAESVIAIATQSKTRLEGIRRRTKPRIQRVPETLRKAGTNRERCFEPEVVSLGPYHYGRPELAAMEEHKQAAAATFAGDSMRSLYDKVREVTIEARRCYVEEFNCLSEEQFANMMFFDGCFILHFIDCYLKRDPSAILMTPAHLHGSIVRDIFLLENQVPFKVLEVLTTTSSLRPVDLRSFVGTIADIYYNRSSENGGGSGPIHLLDLLRSTLLEGNKFLPGKTDREALRQIFRSVIELKTEGINCARSNTGCLHDVSFKQGLLHGQLRLPQIAVNDLTRPRLLNLIAFELCPDGHTDYGIISYVCLLDSLVNDARDVEELRWQGIVLNALGTDQQVADMLKDLAIGLSPDDNAYIDAARGIYRHCGSHTRVFVARMLYRHFNSPWATISFVAAMLLFVMTALQTFFTVFSKFSMG